MLFRQGTRNFVFGLLLALAQTLAAAHAIGHGLGQDEGGAPNPVCQWCAAFGHLGAALPGTGTQPALCGAHVLAEQALPSSYFSPLLLAFHSQAPPRFS